MTREEAIEELKKAYPKKCEMVNHRLQGGFNNHDAPLGRAIDMAIWALSAEPCEDAISNEIAKEERKLAITYLEEIKENYIEGAGYERHPIPEYYAIETAIKVLEQEPCEDVLCHTNLKENAELIAKILDADICGEIFEIKKATINKITESISNAIFNCDPCAENQVIKGLQIALDIIAETEMGEGEE